MPRLVVIDHPLAQVKLGLLRDQATPSPDFRRALRECAALMFYLATADVPTVPTTVQTPLAPCPAVALARPLVLAPILRAGLGLLEGVFDLVAEAQIAHLGMYRDERTLKPVTYYAKVPPNIGESEVILLAKRLPWYWDEDYTALALQAEASRGGSTERRGAMLGAALRHARWCASCATAGGEGLARSVHVRELQALLHGETEILLAS